MPQAHLTVLYTDKTRVLSFFKMPTFTCTCEAFSTCIQYIPRSLIMCLKQCPPRRVPSKYRVTMMRTFDVYVLGEDRDVMPESGKMRQSTACNGLPDLSCQPVERRYEANRNVVNECGWARLLSWTLGVVSSARLCKASPHLAHE